MSKDLLISISNVGLKGVNCKTTFQEVAKAEYFDKNCYGTCFHFYRNNTIPKKGVPQIILAGALLIIAYSSKSNEFFQ